MYSKEYVSIKKLSANNSRSLAVTLLSGIVMRPPGSPRIGIVPERCARNDPQRSIHQFPRRRVQRIVIGKIKQMRNSGQAFFPSQ